MNRKKIVRLGIALLSMCTMIAASALSVSAAKKKDIGTELPDKTVYEYIYIYNAAEENMTISFDGKLVGDYRINDNTAVCNWSAGGGAAGFGDFTNKYIYENSDKIAKIMYYWLPNRGIDTPSGRDTTLSSSVKLNGVQIKGQTFYWLYNQLGYSMSAAFANNAKGYTFQTYGDFVTWALYYQGAVKNYADAQNSIKQYVTIHCLLDKIQHHGYTDDSRGAAEKSADMLERIIENSVVVSFPEVPSNVRVYIVNPEPNKDTQTLLSIEYTEGYFRINKQSANPNVTSNNTNYVLAGAEYSWYKTKSAAQAAATAVANGQSVPQGQNYIGYSEISGTIANTLYRKENNRWVASGVCPLGTYYLVETKAPKGYALSSDVKELTISAANGTDTNRATVTFYDPPLYGSLAVSKSGTNPAVALDNSLYSLTGAEYTVYRDSALQNVYAIITTRNGTASLNNIPFGTYYVKETKASKGYMLNSTVYSFSVNSTTPSATISTTEPISYVTAPTLLSKKASDTGNALAGAKFIVEYFDKEFDSESYEYTFTPKKRWLFETDSNGQIILDAAHLATSYTNSSGETVSFTNSSFYLSEVDNSTAVLPRGTIMITEVEAPTVRGQDGNLYKYKLDDTPTIRQVTVKSDESVEYKTVELKNDIEGALTTTISGKKTWNDNNNANGNRPDEIIIRLRKSVNGTNWSTCATAVVTEEDDWKYEFTELPLTEIIDGVEYPVKYSIREAVVNIAGYYTPHYSGNDVTNTEDETKLTVKKVWNDKNNQDGVRPQSVIVRLYADSQYTGKFASLSENNNWTYTFENLPVSINRERINYTVKEDEFEVSEGTYTVSVSSTAGTYVSGYECTVTNTHDPVDTSVVVKKVWKDADDLDKIRPRKIQVKLLGYVNNTVVNESDVVTMTASGNATDDPNVWSYTFTNLDKYYDGNVIDYVASELTLIDEYNLDENGDPQTVTAALTSQEDGSYACVLENTHTIRRTSMNVLKVWDDDDNRDGLRPDAVTVYVATVDDNGTKTRYTDSSGNEVMGVLQESNDWAWQFTDLPIYDANKNVITYSVEEVVPAGYTVSYKGDAANGVTVTNTHHESTSVTVNKVWDDKNDQDDIRPDSVVVNLLADGTEIDNIELNEDNNWTYTFTDLPVNQNGSKISYTVTEDSITVPTGFSGYSVRYSALKGNAQTGYSYTVTNTHTPEVQSVSVNKVWSDSNNRDGIRPEQVEVLLSVSSPTNTGIATKRAILSEDNSWSYTFTNLPKYYNGTLIQYTVDETDFDIEFSANGYTKTISGDMSQGFTITNSHLSERIKLVIDKVWDDNDDSALMRPNTATFEVKGDQGQVSTVTLSASNNWHYEQTYNRFSNGEFQEPEVKEIALAEGYVGRKVLTVNHPSGSRVTTYQYTWTNTYEPEPTSVSVRKIWADETYGEDFGIIVELHRHPVGQATDTYIDNIVLTSYNDWQGEFEGVFPRYVDGVEYEYYIQEYVLDYRSYFDDGEYIWYDNEFEYRENTSEVFLADYTAEITGNNIEGYVIVNTSNDYTNMDLPFVKIWEDGDNADGIRPPTIDVVLRGYVGGYASEGYFDSSTEVITRHAVVKAADGWKYTFTDLPALCTNTNIVGTIDDYADSYEYADARLIYYTVEEIIPSGYTQTLNMQSYYLHDKDEYYYDVYSDSNKHPQEQLCRYLTIPECRRAKEEHTGFIYWVSHNSVSPNQIAHNGGYRYDMNLGLVNKYTPATTSVKVNKVWDDKNDQDGVRPDSVTINLLADGVEVRDVVLNENNGWSYTFTNLPVNDNGSAITYSVTEDAVSTPDGFSNYVLQPIESDGNTTDGWVYTFTNKYEPETTQVTALKRWQDNNNRLGFRPNALLLTLKADGVSKQHHWLTATDYDSESSSSAIDAWKYVFSNLPKYNNGVEIQYTVEEQLTGDVSYYYTNMRTTTSTDANGYKTVTFINKNKTATITIQKKDQNGDSLAGSEFELFFADGTPVKLRLLYEGRYSYDPSLTTYVNKVSLTSGSVTIDGLPPNATIIAREVTAPNAYSAYANSITIDIQQVINDEGLESSRTGVYTLPETLFVVNNYKTVMPATGSVGDYAIYLLSGMFLIGAFFILRKRKDGQS